MVVPVPPIKFAPSAGLWELEFERTLVKDAMTLELPALLIKRPFGKSLGQIKELALIDNVMSPFVRTIIAPL